MKEESHLIRLWGASNLLWSSIMHMAGTSDQATIDKWFDICEEILVENNPKLFPKITMEHRK